jgi:hypothetical protein
MSVFDYKLKIKPSSDISLKIRYFSTCYSNLAQPDDSRLIDEYMCSVIFQLESIALSQLNINFCAADQCLVSITQTGPPEV